MPDNNIWWFRNVARRLVNDHDVFAPQIAVAAEGKVGTVIASIVASACAGYVLYLAGSVELGPAGAVPILSLLVLLPPVFALLVQDFRERAVSLQRWNADAYRRLASWQLRFSGAFLAVIVVDIFYVTAVLSASIDTFGQGVMLVYLVLVGAIGLLTVRDAFRDMN